MSVGFSCQATASMLLALPQTLRGIADGIEADLVSKGLEEAPQ